MPAARPARRNSAKLRVGVCVEDQTLREQVCAALVDGGHTISARVASPKALVSTLNGNELSCIVLGTYRPDKQTLDITRQLRGKIENVPAVIVCERASSGEIRRTLELGISGIVLATELDGALAPVAAAACAGQVSVPGSQSDHVRAEVLTTREKQILGLVVMGLTNAEIARKLFLAESTVKSHLSSAFSKLGVSSRNEAVSLILDPERSQGLGILTIPAEKISSPA